MPDGKAECRMEERFAEDSMKDSSGYLERETPKDLETEKDSRQKDTALEKKGGCALG
jgi:hypothetical protein